MTRTRRLAAFGLTLTLVPALGACGEGGFGDFIRGSGSANTASSSPAEATTTSTALPVGTESPSSSTSPSESVTDTSTSTDATGSPTDASSTSPETSPGATSPSATGGASGTTGVSAPATTAPTAPQGGVVQVDGRTIQDVPVGLAFPEGARIESMSAFEGGGGSVVLGAPAEAKVFAYYRSTLPGAGYRVVSDTDGLLAFTGRGYRGSVVGTGTGAVLTWSPARS